MDWQKPSLGATRHSLPEGESQIVFKSLAGHKKQQQLLSSALAKGKLAHAYVFAGPDNVGKKTIAKKLALELMAVGNSENNFHPDFHEINGQDGIKIEQIRELTYQLSLKPYQAKHKVAVIDCADEMTMEAANALLKVLEEPKAYTYIFLITSNPNRLPKTILSRCQKITFGPVEFSEYEFLLPEKISKDKQKLIDTLAAGKPGLALKIASDESYLEEVDKQEEYFGVFMSDKLTDRLVAAYEIADLETSEIRNVLDAWVLKLQTSLRENPTKQVAQKISQLSEQRKLLDMNVNSKLLLTNLMLKT